MGRSTFTEAELRRYHELCGLKKLNEYNFATGIREAGEEAQADPNAMAAGAQGAQDPNAAAMGMQGAADPSMMAGMDPNAMAAGMQGADPNAMGAGMPMADPNAGGMGAQDMADPSMMAGADLNADMGADPSMMGGDDANAQVGPDDEVVDIDKLTRAQETTEYKVDALSDKFSKVIAALDKFDTAVKDNNDKIESLKAEIERRNPTQEEKLSARTAQSGPYVETPKPEDETKDKLYTITTDDIENVNTTDAFKSIADYPHSFVDFFK